MKSSRLLFIPILMLISIVFFISSPSYGGVEEDVTEIKKDISELKKELQEIKKLLRSRSRGPAQPPTPSASEASIDDDPILGDVDAPVTLIEFSDYKCPFCARFYRDTLPRIKKDYIEKGKVRYVFRDFPILSIHPQAQKAAEAAQCSGDQGAYWEMHDRIFENQQAMKIEDLKGHAEKLSLNMEDFNKCLDEGKYAEEVKKDIQAGQKAGVRGTPSFILGKTTKDGKVNGRFIRGAQPYQAFKVAIDALLENEEH
ncbi:MAG: DsbA family protein [Thermodesulfobacteriota bacterium]